MSRVQLGLLVCTLAMAGCGGSSAPEGLINVYGNVTLDGEPLPNATVIFTPVEGGRPAAGVTDSGGDYELEYSAGTEGALPGKYQVSISTATTETNDEGEDVEIPEKLPAKYNAHTELEVEVTPDQEEFDFELNSEGEIYEEENVRD